METEAAREIIAILPRGRTLFHYFPERYAVYLLSNLIGEGMAISDVKASAYGKLLNRQIIKPIVASKGDGMLYRDDFAQCWAVQPECYLLTLGIWGPEKRKDWNHYYYQTSRPGVNLVLQLNFSSLHNEEYRKLIRPPDGEGPFETRYHPIARQGFHTLAWSRLDIDLDSGEALIEEVQTDWLRYAFGAKRQADQLIMERFRAQVRAIEEGAEYDDTDDGSLYYGGTEMDPHAVNTYVYEVLREHIRVWDEALLTAVIDFVTSELGLKRIYYHDFDCGCRLKNISGRLPPRDVYTKLPARFCFRRTETPPLFLEDAATRSFKTLKRAGSLRFWKLEL